MQSFSCRQERVLQLAKNRPKSLRSGKSFDVNIKAIFVEHKGRNGAPRITKALKAQSVKCSLNRVSSRMDALNLKALAKKKFKVAPEILIRKG